VPAIGPEGSLKGIAIRAGARDEPSVDYAWLRRPRRLLALVDGLAALAALLALQPLSVWHPLNSNSALQSAHLGVGLVVVLTLVLGFRNGQYTSSRRSGRRARVLD
jgi:hypothetical protein